MFCHNNTVIVFVIIFKFELPYNCLLVYETKVRSDLYFSYYPFTPISLLIEMLLQHDPDDRPSCDQILRLPSLRPHIVTYEDMALGIIESKNTKRDVSIDERCYTHLPTHQTITYL